MGGGVRWDVQGRFGKTVFARAHERADGADTDQTKRKDDVKQIIDWAAGDSQLQQQLGVHVCGDFEGPLRGRFRHQQVNVLTEEPLAAMYKGACHHR